MATSRSANPRDRRLYGHRGASARFPENTLPAFREALAGGANALETDVHVTRDGAVVVCHDPDGRRIAGDPRRIADCTLADVRGWQVGILPEGAPARLATIEELLVAFPGTRINVDLKSPHPKDVVPVLEQVRRQAAGARVTLASFHNAVVARLLREGYPGEVSLGRSEVLQLRLAPFFWVRRMPLAGRAVQIPRAALGLRLDGARFIDRCHRIGLRVDYWVINDPGEARLLLARGADGIVSDDPVKVAGAFPIAG